MSASLERTDVVNRTLRRCKTEVQTFHRISGPAGTLLVLSAAALVMTGVLVGVGLTTGLR